MFSAVALVLTTLGALESELHQTHEIIYIRAVTVTDSLLMMAIVEVF